MSSEQANERAKEYIDSSLASQRRLGYSPSVSDAQYRAAVGRAAEAFDTLIGDRGGAARPVERGGRRGGE